MKKNSYFILILLFLLSCSHNSVENEKQLIISELYTFASLAQGWYRTPSVIGGGDFKTIIEQNDLNQIAKFISDLAIENTISNKIGTYSFIISDVDNYISIYCQSKKYPQNYIGVLVCLESGMDDIILLTD